MPLGATVVGGTGVQTPTVTGTTAPVLSTAVAPQVAAMAVPAAELVQVIVVFTVAPGLLTKGTSG